MKILVSYLMFAKWPQLCKATSPQMETCPVHIYKTSGILYLSGKHTSPHPQEYKSHFATMNKHQFLINLDHSRNTCQSGELVGCRFTVCLGQKIEEGRLKHRVQQCVGGQRERERERKRETGERERQTDRYTDRHRDREMERDRERWETSDKRDTDTETDRKRTIQRYAFKSTWFKELLLWQYLLLCRNKSRYVYTPVRSGQQEVLALWPQNPT